MRTFKKLLLSALCFLLIVTILSIAIIAPPIRKESGYYHDAGLRRSLAGSIDYIVLGASHALAAFVPALIDEELGCNSYNLSGSMMPASSKYWLLKKELERNPVKTVVLELSYNSLIRDSSNEYADGASVTVQRMDSVPEAIEYMLHNVTLNDWLNLYARLLVSGMVYWKNILLGNTESHVDRAAKGYHATASVDVSLTPEEARECYSSDEFPTDYAGEEVEITEEIIRMCHEKGIRVIIVVTPVADSLIWKADSWDEFESWMRRFSEENGCEFYDFNLLKTRNTLLSDADSFHDGAHMSGNGAVAFSTAFAEIMHRVDMGQDVSSYFYGSYAELKQTSPYQIYLDATTSAQSSG